MLKVTTTFSSFSANDLAKAQEFYEKTLGLKTEKDSMGLELHLPGDADVFIYEKKNHEPATFTVLNFIVGNIDEAVDELKSRGVFFERYEGMSQDEKNIARGRAAKMGPD
ncbi:MAG: VOC family protein, partial [Minisyncoccia bacterium]